MWVGIGAAGAAVKGIRLLGEAGNPGRLLVLGMLLVAIAGLKLTSPAPETTTCAPLEIVD